MAKVGSLKFFLIIGVIAVIFLPPFAKYQEMRYKNQKLQERINELKADNNRLGGEVSKLQKDIVYIEGKARDKIGVVRKGEIIIKEPQKN